MKAAQPEELLHDIQQLRYAGRFEMEYRGEGSAGWTVPRFVLQPLVETPS